MSQELIYTNEVSQAIESVCAAIAYDRCYVLCDVNSREEVLPLLTAPVIADAKVITVPAGDASKDVEALTHVWQALIDGGATRHSLLINVGGGMVCDLGGFAASTFKRGIAHINIPTTLLAAVDAAVGGKTGINFGGLKNAVGTFSLPRAVVISTCFFATLPRQELLSGYAEMIKHGLIDGEEHYNALLDGDVTQCDGEQLLGLLQRSVEVKKRIVEQDPCENGVRKILNLGHTIGHAFESHALNQGRPIPHGYAVAWGIVCELLLSHRLLSFPSAIIYDLAHFVESHYGSYAITCEDYGELYGYMCHDKKNIGDGLRFALMRNIGQCVTDVPVEQQEIEIALDFYRDLFHL